MARFLFRFRVAFVKDPLCLCLSLHLSTCRLATVLLGAEFIMPLRQPDLGQQPAHLAFDLPSGSARGKVRPPFAWHSSLGANRVHLCSAHLLRATCALERQGFSASEQRCCGPAANSLSWLDIPVLPLGQRVRTGRAFGQTVCSSDRASTQRVSVRPLPRWTQRNAAIGLRHPPQQAALLARLLSHTHR